MKYPLYAPVFIFAFLPVLAMEPEVITLSCKDLKFFKQTPVTYKSLYDNTVHNNKADLKNNLIPHVGYTVYCADWVADLSWLYINNELLARSDAAKLYKKLKPLYDEHKKKLTDLEVIDSSQPAQRAPLQLFVNNKLELTIDCNSIISLLTKIKAAQAVAWYDAPDLYDFQRNRTVTSILASQAALMDANKIKCINAAKTLPGEIQLFVKKHVIQLLLQESTRTYIQQYTFKKYVADMFVKDEIIITGNYEITTMSIPDALLCEQKLGVFPGQQGRLIAEYVEGQSYFYVPVNNKNEPYEIKQRLKTLVTIKDEVSITSLQTQHPYLIFTTSDGAVHFYSYKLPDEMIDKEANPLTFITTFCPEPAIVKAHIVGKYVVATTKLTKNDKIVFVWQTDEETKKQANLFYTLQGTYPSVHILESATGKLVKTITQVPHIMLSLASYSDTELLFGGMDGQVGILNIGDDCITLLPRKTYDQIMTVAADNAKIVAGTIGGDVIIWDRALKRHMHTFAAAYRKSEIDADVVKIKKIQLSSCGVICILFDNGQLSLFKPARAIAALNPAELEKLDLEVLALLPPFI